MNKSYVSIFKIDGFPILPPLMTDKKREDMKNYKYQAIQLERRLNSNKRNQYRKKNIPDSLHFSSGKSDLFNTSSSSISEDSPESIIVESDDYNKIVQRFDEINIGDSCFLKNLSDIQSKQKALLLQKTDTTVYDIENNIVTKGFHSVPSERCSLSQDFSPSSPSYLFSSSITSNFDQTNSNNKTTRSSVSAPLMSSRKETYSDSTLTMNDSMLLTTPTPRHKTQTNENTRAKSSAGLYEHSIRKTPPLIRSNSYTLLQPSPMLVKHMESKGFDITNTLGQTEKINRVKSEKNLLAKERTTTTTTKIKPKTPPPPPKTNTKQNPASISRKKSPYDIKAKSKIVQNKNTKPQQTPTTVVPIKSPATKQPPPKSIIKNTSSENLQIILTKIEHEQRKQIEQLMLKQQEEQKLMQENFCKQQEILLRQIKESIPSILSSPSNNNNVEQQINITSPKFNDTIKTVRTSTPTSFTMNKSEDGDFSNLNGSFFYHNLTPKTTTTATNNECTNTELTIAMKPVSQAYLKHHLGIVKNQKSSTEKGKRSSTTSVVKERSNNPLEKCIRKLFPSNKTSKVTVVDELTKKSNAATIINSYVRGYLVRRLLKTDYAQKIIQTIQDTLIFVLDLHEESKYTNNPIEIQLKGQLLSQLSSSCRNLHKLFFNTNVKERMDIISKDRDLMKLKFRRSLRLSSDSNNNNNNKQKPNVPSSKQNLKNFDMCSL